MIDEAIGKILGMAMAYGVSTLGLFLAYVNYRKRILKAEKIMTPTAWGVVAAVILVLAAGVGVVAQLAQPPSAQSTVEATLPEAETTGPAESIVPEAMTPAASSAVGTSEERDRWPWIGIVLPAGIFLIATWITAGLHRHFSTVGPES